MSTLFNITFHPDARTLLLVISMAIGSDDGTPRLGMRQVGKNWCRNGNWALRYHLGFLRRVFEVVTLLNTKRVYLGHSNRSCSLLVCKSLNEESQEEKKWVLLKEGGGGSTRIFGPFSPLHFWSRNSNVLNFELFLRLWGFKPLFLSHPL